MNKSIIALLSLALLTFTASSCQDAAPASISKLIAGKWKFVKISVDQNGNGLASSDETLTDTVFDHTFYYFNADGTGGTAYYSDTQKFSWSAENNNTYIRFTETATNESYSNQLVNISSSRMTIKDTTGGDVVWVVLQKL